MFQKPVVWFIRKCEKNGFACYSWAFSIYIEKGIRISNLMQATMKSSFSSWLHRVVKAIFSKLLIIAHHSLPQNPPVLFIPCNRASNFFPMVQKAVNNWASIYHSEFILFCSSSCLFCTTRTDLLFWEQVKLITSVLYLGCDLLPGLNTILILTSSCFSLSFEFSLRWYYLRKW